MMQFAQEFPDEQIVATVSRQLSWSHFVELLPLKESLQREFYLTMAASEKWSKRTLKSNDIIIHLKNQIRLLTEARDRLLPKLMSGEIAV